MLSFMTLTAVGLAVQLAYVDCTRCLIDGQRSANCDDGCLILYTTRFEVKHGCYVRYRLNKYIGEDHCHRDVSIDDETPYTIGCRCMATLCNYPFSMLVMAACRSVFPVRADDRWLYQRINTCECARNNPIACSSKQEKMNKLCTGSDRSCPANIPNYDH